MAKTYAKWLSKNTEHFDINQSQDLTLLLEAGGGITSTVAGLKIADSGIVDAMLASTFIKSDGSITMDGGYVPSTALAVATKDYVDTAISGGIGSIQFQQGKIIIVNGSSPQATDDRTGLQKDDLFNPFATIGAAIAAASFGDLIIVAPGTYAEQVTMTDGISLHLQLGVEIAPVGVVSVLISGAGNFSITGAGKVIGTTTPGIAAISITGVTSGSVFIELDTVNGGSFYSIDSSVSSGVTVTIDVKHMILMSAISGAASILLRLGGTGDYVVNSELLDSTIRPDYYAVQILGGAKCTARFNKMTGNGLRVEGGSLLNVEVNEVITLKDFGKYLAYVRDASSELNIKCNKAVVTQGFFIGTGASTTKINATINYLDCGAGGLIQTSSGDNAAVTANIRVGSMKGTSNCVSLNSGIAASLINVHCDHATLGQHVVALNNGNQQGTIARISGRYKCGTTGTLVDASSTALNYTVIIDDATVECGASTSFAITNDNAGQGAFKIIQAKSNKPIEGANVTNDIASPLLVVDPAVTVPSNL